MAWERVGRVRGGVGGAREGKKKRPESAALDHSAKLPSRRAGGRPPRLSTPDSEVWVFVECSLRAIRGVPSAHREIASTYDSSLFPVSPSPLPVAVHTHVRFELRISGVSDPRCRSPCAFRLPHACISSQSFAPPLPAAVRTHPCGTEISKLRTTLTTAYSEDGRGGDIGPPAPD